MMTVASFPSPAGEITVRKRLKTGSYLYEQGDCYQSEADENGVSLSSYIHALFSLIHQKRCTRILMIGCGGGTLATLLTRAGAHVTVVDNNSTAFDLARRYFQMPPHVKSVVADGESYLISCAEIYDAIVLDAHDGSFIPNHLRSSRFLRLVRRRLDRSDGVFLANVYLHHDFDLTADRLAEVASGIWREVTILDARDKSDRNAFVLSGALGNIEAPTLLVPPNTRVMEIEYDLSCLQFRECRFRVGDGAGMRFRRLADHQDLYRHSAFSRRPRS